LSKILEVIPDTNKLITTTAAQIDGVYQTPHAAKCIQRAFDIKRKKEKKRERKKYIFDFSLHLLSINKSGKISKSEFREVLNIMDVPCETEAEFEALLREVDTSGDGHIEMREWQDMMYKQTFNKVHQGRYFVAVSKLLFFYIYI
jgi:hypothetical protein